MVPEAPLIATAAGQVPDGDGWFVVNARAARWLHSADLGSYCPFEGDTRFDEVAINVQVLQPGQPNCMYHGEGVQEDFLVVSGACLVIIEGRERELGPWDLVHCPRWTEHVFVGAGDGPCVLIGVSGRAEAGVRYPVDAAALGRGAGVAVETAKPDEAYAECAPNEAGPYRPGDLPGEAG